MTDPPNEFESQSVPGYGDSGDRLPKANNNKPNTDSISFFPRPCQLEFHFELPRRTRLTKNPMGKKGYFVSNLICPSCLKFVTFLESGSRRMYRCNCGCLLLSARDRLNRQPPTLAEWEMLIRAWQHPGPIFNHDKQ
jgi:hypothetical protein